MTTFIQDVESIVKKQGENGLIYLEQYYGLELELLREDNRGDSYSDAYGNSSGSTVSKVQDFKGVLQGNDFIQRSDHFTGNFEEGFLYVRGVDIRPSDIIQIKSDIVRKYKVEEKKEIGLTKSVFTVWGLINLGD